MFERFTERARKVVVKAQDEARFLKQNYIGTEHILLGLIDEKEGIASRVFQELGISINEIRAAIKDVVTEGTSESYEHIPFTPRAKKVLANNNFILKNLIFSSRLFKTLYSIPIRWL